ncbi:MAG: coproporphyrinogen dehydrogenase HemZ, partial [Clostridia bacterium]|nr:coproporphyrinogen dehydrogenase HemZ [Clostridia bacterium]
SLCESAVSGEKAITSLSRPESFSLYLSVPFCPSRCSYCSFVSHSVDKAKNIIPRYVELLCEELKITGEIANKLGLRLETVYMGGGTPTTLEANQLDTVLKTVRDNFDMSNVREFTVEAGRPDTVTIEKLKAIKTNGVSRISINPQTLNDDVLRAIGRNHTAQQAAEAFVLARKLGFENINMDLIAGLPGDTFESFKSTVERVIYYGPESVTVHSLSMKRASYMSISGEYPEIEAGKVASDMVDFARTRVSENGIVPYYMYRQSKTVGNLENVGYAKHGFEGLYNVYIMDETHTILACGASAVTKLREPHGNYIDRIFNFKYPYEYISRFEEMTDRKQGITEFYRKYPIY